MQKDHIIFVSRQKVSINISNYWIVHASIWNQSFLKYFLWVRIINFSITPKLSLKNKEHQKSDFLTGFNFWRFKSNPCVITFLSNSKTAYYWVPWDSNDVEAFPSVVLISYARSQAINAKIIWSKFSLRFWYWCQSF